jgi:hypothetical protein
VPIPAIRRGLAVSLPRCGHCPGVRRLAESERGLLDHASLDRTDISWLSPVRTLTLWSVKVPVGLLASLPKLTRLDLRGGSAESLSRLRSVRD